MKGKEPMSAKERVKASRDRRYKWGMRQINIWVTPEADLALREIQERLKAKGYKPTQSDIVCAALLRKPVVDIL